MEKLRDREYGGVEDFIPVREFLTELRGLLPPGQSWDVRRWDGSNCHTIEIGLDDERTAMTHLWEAPDARIIAAAMSEGGRQIHPHVHPGWIHVLDQVVAWAEEAGQSNQHDAAFLTVWDHDVALRGVAECRGYVETEQYEYVRTARFGAWSIPLPEIADGYTIRAVHMDAADHQRVADIVNAAFGRTSHVEEDHRALAQNAPSYREHLDLAAIAPDGSFAAYGAVNVDDTNHVGTFEPVCTHPEHRQRGLARALMLEGMRRAQESGIEEIEVGTGNLDPANALYDSLPFAHKYRGKLWRRDI